jgi:hypothetical protein
MIWFRWKVPWRVEAALCGMSFVQAVTEKSWGWAIAGMLWLAWAMHDRDEELKEAIERLRNTP